MKEKLYQKCQLNFTLKPETEESEPEAKDRVIVSTIHEYSQLMRPVLS